MSLDLQATQWVGATVHILLIRKEGFGGVKQLTEVVKLVKLSGRISMQGFLAPGEASLWGMGLRLERFLKYLAFHSSLYGLFFLCFPKVFGLLKFRSFNGNNKINV